MTEGSLELTTEKETTEELDDTEWLKDKENEIWERLRRKKKEIWEIGRVLYEVRERHAYKEGFMKWVKRFHIDLPYRTAYDYMRIYICCPMKEIVEHFPLKFLRKMCKATFPEKLRQFLFDHREAFNTGLTDDKFDQIVENVTGEDFDPQDPELQKLLTKRDEHIEESRKIDRNESDLRRKKTKYEEWLASARSGLVTHKDGKVRIRRKVFEEELSDVVRELEKLGLMPEYELID